MKTSFAFLFTLLCFTGFTQSIERIDGISVSSSTIDEQLPFLIDAANVHGLSLFLFSGKEILYESTLGYKNQKENQSLKNTHTLYAASLSKPLFAYLVLQLVDEGKLDLDEPLVNYLDQPIGTYVYRHDYERYDDLQKDERHTLITARMCLAHTTGLPNWRYIVDGRIQFDHPLELEFDPGTTYSYSGEGIQLLQRVVEVVTQEKLETLAKKYVFAPLGMDQTSFLWQETFEGNYAVGHYKKKKILNRIKRDDQYAAGSMETTSSDYVKFLQGVLRQQGLSTSSYQEMITPQITIRSTQQFGPKRFIETDAHESIQLSYGLGWGIYQTPYGKAVFKEGHLQGWEHLTVFYPEKDLGILIMTNSSNGESVFKELLEVTVGDTWLPWYWENFIPYDQ
ncbi:MAG: serine hydrolase domain-containing protein [Bacteroidota bacterium]